MAKDIAPYTETLKTFKKHYNEKEVLNGLMKDVEIIFPCLRKVTTCVSIGTGYGDYDLDFLRTCLPYLKTLIVIEKNEDCLRELKINLEEFSDNLEVYIIKSTIERFIQINELGHWFLLNEIVEDSSPEKVQKVTSFFMGKIEIVLAFHVLHFLDQAHRRALYKLCLGQWMWPEEKLNNIFVFVSMSGEDSTIVRLIKELTQDSLVISEIIKNELNEQGGFCLHDFSYECLMDVPDINNLREIVKSMFPDFEVNESSLAEVAKKIVPNGKSILKASMCLYAKKN
ncbi:hypothetical protein HELRODRAFT_167268 [Helobdella robusta]|uniref:Methyltransferase domain-containing protein n=1 Tax=Helobdella robusta TaxID=6412 RepID=T1EZ72_HELRO|nr:hypothetical protein HELRODRAFT_167268 [Helobdella robusta]ESO10770.1 hypothetical protein HELRODRAFT_167268 [Helobdella robusta]